MTLQFTIPCAPVAQPRQRHRVVQTAAGRTFAANYTPTRDPVNAFKATTQLKLAEIYQGPPLVVPVKLEALFLFPRPKSLKKVGRQWHGKKPDAENCGKALLDALEGQLLANDSLAADVRFVKRYAAAGEQPRVEVTLETLG